MRALGAGIGLLGLLVAIAIMMSLWAGHTATVSSAGKQATQDVNQMTGRDTDTGLPAKDTIKLEPFSVNGKLKHVLVDSLVAGGAFEKFYGLKQNDLIIATGSMDFRDQDGDMAVDLIQRAYQTKDTLIVLREGQKITLPLPPGAAAPTPAGTAAPAPRSNDSALQRQLDAIPGVR